MDMKMSDNYTLYQSLMKQQNCTNFIQKEKGKLLTFIFTDYGL